MMSPSALKPEPSADWDLPPVPVLDPERGLLPSGEAEQALQSPKVRKEDLAALQEWMRQENLPATADIDLVKFLHSCDYDVQKAKKCVKVFHTSRAQIPDLFTDWIISSPELKKVLDIAHLCIVPRKTPENYRIIISCLLTSDTTNFDDLAWYKACMMILESLFITEPTLDGVIFISDLKNVTFGHFWKMSWSFLRKMNAYTSAGLPLKQHGAHCINAPGFMEKIMRMMQYVVSKEDIDRTYLHRENDFAVLHQKLPLYCLPSDLGGTLPSMAELHDMTVKRLGEFKQVFQWLQSSRDDLVP